MDVSDALAGLADVSNHVEAAVVADSAGEVVGSTLDDGDRAVALADAARRLLDEASAVRRGARAWEAAAVTRTGALVVARDEELLVGAVTNPEPPVRLVLYDLRACLRALRTDTDAPVSRSMGGDDAP
jgi:hypothetical protein